jgi:hypothetical protein
VIGWAKCQLVARTSVLAPTDGDRREGKTDTTIETRSSAVACFEPIQNCYSRSRRPPQHRHANW